MPKEDYNGKERRQMNPVIIEKLDRINASVNDIKVISEDNRRALRGHNSSPGMVAGVDANCKAIKALEAKSNRNDTIVGVGTIIGSVVGFIFGKE